MHSILRFLRRENGATAIEYAVMLAAILAVIIGTVEIFGSRTEGVFASTVEKIANIIN